MKATVTILESPQAASRCHQTIYSMPRSLLSWTPHGNTPQGSVKHSNEHRYPAPPTREAASFPSSPHRFLEATVLLCSVPCGCFSVSLLLPLNSCLRKHFLFPASNYLSLSLLCKSFHIRCSRVSCGWPCLTPLHLCLSLRWVSEERVGADGKLGAVSWCQMAHKRGTL